MRATFAEFAANGIDAEAPSSPDGSDDFLTSFVVDPDGNRIELVQWPAGTPTASRQPTSPIDRQGERERVARAPQRRLSGTLDVAHPQACLLSRAPGRDGTGRAETTFGRARTSAPNDSRAAPSAAPELACRCVSATGGLGRSPAFDDSAPLSAGRSRCVFILA